MHDRLAVAEATIVGVFAAVAGTSGAVVALILGRRKASVETDNVAVETADRLVGLLRADMERVRTEQLALRAELQVAMSHVAQCEAELTELRRRLADGLGDGR